MLLSLWFLDYNYLILHLNCPELGKVKPKFSYSEKQMEMAINSVKSGNMHQILASRTFKVPWGTLFDKVKGRTPMKRKMGRDPYLTKAEEKEIVQYV